MEKELQHWQAGEYRAQLGYQRFVWFIKQDMKENIANSAGKWREI